MGKGWITSPKKKSHGRGGRGIFIIETKGKGIILKAKHRVEVRDVKGAAALGKVELEGAIKSDMTNRIWTDVRTLSIDYGVEPLELNQELAEAIG